MTSYPCNKYEQITPSYLLSVKYIEVQDYVQLAMAKFCLSIKDCRSQASFNDCTIKGLGPKILAQGPKFLGCYEKICFAYWFQNSN